MKAIIVLNPLEVILNVSHHFDSFPVVLLHGKGLSEDGHVLVVQKGKGELPLAKVPSYVMRLSSFNLEVVIIRLVDVLK